MGFLKKLYGESQKVRHSGNFGKEVRQVSHGVRTKSNVAIQRTKRFGYEVRMKFGR